MKFNLTSDFLPTGDQPQAIEALVAGCKDNEKFQQLLGVTGSGKTFTMANVIERISLPTLVISHNKTLAAQLYQEFRDFFPNNAVGYFVSYYDYYQPEAYIPHTDTYIEKETDINEEIDKLRLAATTNLMTRQDVIIVASVSCIYNIGSPVEYGRYLLDLKLGDSWSMRDLLDRLIDLQYMRSTYELRRGTFRVRGDSLEMWPAYEDSGLRVEFLDGKLVGFCRIEPTTGRRMEQVDVKHQIIYPAKHYLTNPDTQAQALEEIRKDLKQAVSEFRSHAKLVEAARLEQRVSYDLEMIQEFGYVNGIENYSRYFDGRHIGDPPHTLLDYFQASSQEFLVFIDESHMTIPQIRGMHEGDRSRKKTLIEYGFRLPAALDNRPLTLAEFMKQVPRLIGVSATPGPWEKRNALRIVQQLIRPTGLLDPEIEIRPTHGQIDDLEAEIETRVQRGERILVTTLTKRIAEALSGYLKERGINVHYIHSDIKTLDRSDILEKLRLGTFDVVVGINLLREGLDLPEVSLVAILDADKEGFLRSEISLIQTMGRAARHIRGNVIMYADSLTVSMRRAIDEVRRRREVQVRYNRERGITPRSISKPIRDRVVKTKPHEEVSASRIQLSRDAAVDLSTLDPQTLTPSDKKRLEMALTRRMNRAARELDFELAAKIRDAILLLSQA